MMSKKQMLVTASAMITGSVLINLLWIVNKCYREGKAGMPLILILMYLLVVAAGIVIATRQNENISSKSATIYNCVATANLCLSITGAVFVYFDNGRHITLQFIPLLLPLLIGILIFEKFFLRMRNQNNVG